MGSLRGRRSKGKGEGEFEREARLSPDHTPPRSRFALSVALELPFSLPLRTLATQAREWEEEHFNGMESG